MSQDNVIDLKKPEPFVENPLTDILRQGARRLLTAALEAEIALFLDRYKEITDDKGCQRDYRMLSLKFFRSSLPPPLFF